MTIVLRSMGLTLSCLLVAACGDDGAGGGGAASSASTSAGPGSGSSVTGATSSSTKAASATAQSASSGSEEPEPCALADAEDRTGMASVTIVAMGVTYVPKCVRVSAGTEVTFESNFTMHPLVGGAVENGVGVADPTSPITRTDAGASATFTLADPGERPYFCENHASIGMFGTVYVE